jgi:hypothetical protein
MTQAATYAGKWIAFHQGDQSYNFLSDGETLVQSLKDDLPVAPYSTPEFTTLNRRKVVKIVGGRKGTTTAYISASPPYLLVESARYGGAEIINGGPSSAGLLNITTTYSKWGEKVSLSLPPNPIPASSIFSS